MLLLAYSLLGLIFGLIGLASSGVWALIGLALLLGSLAVGTGAAFARYWEAGPLITFGALISSSAFGVFAVLWTSLRGPTS